MAVSAGWFKDREKLHFLPPHDKPFSAPLRTKYRPRKREKSSNLRSIDVGAWQPDKSWGNSGWGEAVPSVSLILVGGGHRQETLVVYM